MGYFAQHTMDLLDGEETIFESLDAAFPQAGQGQLRTLAGCFGFSGDDVEKPCRASEARADAVQRASTSDERRATSASRLCRREIAR